MMFKHLKMRGDVPSHLNGIEAFLQHMYTILLV